MGRLPIPTYCLPTARPQGFPPQPIPKGSSLQLAPLKPLHAPQNARRPGEGHKKPLRGNKGQVGSGLGLMQKLGQSAHSVTPPQPLAKNVPVEIFWPVHMIIAAVG